MKSKKRKTKEMKCFNCSEKIYSDDHYVLLGTYNCIKLPIDDEQYFHFQCFVDWFNEKLSQKMKAQVKRMQDQASHLMENPILAGMISKVKGSDIFMNMLNKNLLPDKPQISLKEVERKIQDDRRKQNRGKPNRRSERKGKTTSQMQKV